MTRLLGLVAAAFVVALSSTGLAGASRNVDWRATFPEQFGGPNHSPFSCVVGDSCGTGEVTGLGQAQDVIVFGAGCGGACDVRTLTFADGSTIVMDETDSNPQTPGNSTQAQPPNSYGSPITIDLTDTIVGGTDRFAGASGTASGQLKIAGGTAIIDLSGTVTF
jgi:hypothetical protein